jgi:hypothetical protein
MKKKHSIILINGENRFGNYLLIFFFPHSLSYLSYKRLAPSDWQQASVTITRRYLPCWSFSLQGNVFAEAYVTKKNIV